MDHIEVLVICVACVACCFSAYVIGTILFFRTMQRGNFMPIILYMSLSDLGMNAVSAFGFPRNGTPLCWIQGILATYFTICSWFWTTMLSYRIYSKIRYGSCALRLSTMHLISWGVPLFLTLIPLTTTNYGSDADQTQWCLFKHRKGSPSWVDSFWSFSTFFASLVICVLLMITWKILITMKFRNSPVKAAVARTYDKVYLYPIAMIVCWSLNILCDDFNRSGHRRMDALSMIFGMSNGILAAIIFMWKSEESRQRWGRYIFPPSHSTAAAAASGANGASGKLGAMGGIGRFDDFEDSSVTLDFQDDADNDGEEAISATRETEMATTTNSLFSNLSLSIMSRPTEATDT